MLLLISHFSTTMNNVLDLSNRDDNDQLASLSATQVEALKNKFDYQTPPARFTDPFKGIMAQVKVRRSLQPDQKSKCTEKCMYRYADV